MSVPIYLKDGNFKEPENESSYFVLANNGLFLSRDVGLYRATLRVDGIPGLQQHDETVQLKLPKIPKSLVASCMGFFYEVFREFRSEAIGILFYSFSQGFLFRVPRQFIYYRPLWQGACEIEHENLSTPSGFLRLGTWQSQVSSNSSAHDPCEKAPGEGLKIVVSGLDASSPSFDISFSILGNRYLVEEQEIFEGFERPSFPPPEEWLAAVEQIGYFFPPYFFVRIRPTLDDY